MARYARVMIHRLMRPRRAAEGLIAGLLIAVTITVAGAQSDDRFAAYQAVGKSLAVTSTSREATEAALWALAEGGNAADAYLTAALTQTVVEPGLTTIGGALGVTYFDAATGATARAGARHGPAAAEKYDFERDDPVTQTGRAMPVPGFIAAVHAAHSRFGKLPWAKLFEPAIRHARDGVKIQPSIIRAARKRGVRHPAGKALWMRKGRFIQPWERLLQPDLARTLQAVAEGGPGAFYEGAFARHYVKRARADRGKLTMKDMAGWRDLMRTSEVALEGSYRGFQVCAPGAGLLTYALHLNEALDLRAAQDPAERTYLQVRIMEEVFLSARRYSKKTHARFVSPAFAKKRAKFVRTSKPRKLSFDDLFNTCFLVVRDRDGNCAWGTHSINSPAAFGAGIVVDGVYAAYVINRKHVRGSGPTARGISTCYALYEDGKPRFIVGSPGYGFVHGPYQFGTAMVEWGLGPFAAVKAPRFGLPASSTGNKPYIEDGFPESVFERLKRRRIPVYRGKASGFTGLVGALTVDDDGRIHVVQDPRRAGGLARAE